MTATHRLPAWPLLGAFAVLASAGAAAQNASPTRQVESFFELRTGAMRSDNILRVSEEPESGTLYSVGMGVDVDRKGRRLSLKALGDLDWVKYPADTFDDQLTGYFEGKATYQLLPEVLLWELEDTYGQLVTDPFAAATPENLQSMNYITTGPQLELPLGGSLRLKASAEYSYTDYESPNVDNDRYSLAAGLVRDLSSSSNLSFNATTQRTSFDDGRNTHYEERQAFLGYGIEGRRMTLDAQLGYSVLAREGKDSNGFMAHLELRRRITASMSLGVFASRQFSDSGDLFRGQLGQRASSAPLIGLAVSDAFQDRSVGASWNFERGRTRMGISGSRRDELYTRNVSSNRRVDRFDVFFERRLRPSLAVLLQGYRQSEDFETSLFESQETGGGAALEWTFSRHFGTALRYVWIDRTSSNSDFEYLERRAGISVFFRPGNRR